MSAMGWAIFFLTLVGGPLTSILWFCFSWSKFKSCIPFTPEYRKSKIRLIVSAVIAGIALAMFLIIMAIYGVTVFFA